MFSVLFEVQPKPENGTSISTMRKCFGLNSSRSTGSSTIFATRACSAKAGYCRCQSWRDEKSVVRWRTAQNHHLVQQKGRNDILKDYHLRVGEIFADNKLPRE